MGCKCTCYVHVSLNFIYFYRALAHDLGIPWVEYWDFLQTYSDMTSDDGLDLLEEYLQKQSLALCIEEALGKLDLLSNSFHSFKYNQMDMSVNQSKDGVGSMNVSWLMSPLADIEESVHEQDLVDIDKYLHGNIMDQVKTLNSSGSDAMKRSVRMDDSITMPKKNIYEYGRMNRSMEWSMDSSDWSQESFTGILTPMSCLSALFSKLSLLDRSRRQRRLSGSPGCLGVSCMGGGYQGLVKSTLNERKKMDTPNFQSNGNVVHDKENEIESNECAYIREARLRLDNNNRDDLKNSNTEGCKDNVDGYQSTELFVVDNNQNNVDDVVDEQAETSSEVMQNVESDVKNIRDVNWREKSQSSSISSYTEDPQAVKELSQMDNEGTESQRQSNDQINDLVNQFSEKVNLDTSVDRDSGTVSDVSIREPLILRKRLTFSDDISEDIMESSTEETSESCHIDITLELDKDRVPSFEFQSMFELLNERKTLTNQKEGPKRRVIYSRDIVLDLAGKNLEDVSSVILNVAIVPPNSTVAEMTIFSNIPFFVIRGSQYKPGDSFPSKLPTMVDVILNFVKDSVTSALAVNNKSRGKIYFISGQV